MIRNRYHFSCPISRQLSEVPVSIDALTQAWSEALSQNSDQLGPAAVSFLRKHLLQFLVEVFDWQ